MKFCSECGAGLSTRIPPGDNLPRFVCDTCQVVHYVNPKLVAGCIPEWEDKILLCRRAIEPRIGHWTFPAGFMEVGESTEQAAIRETFEEAHADVEITSLYAVLSLPRISQVHMIFRGVLHKPEFKPGTESLDVRLFALDAIPWDDLAFPVIHEALERYVADVARGAFSMHFGSVFPRMKS